MICIIFCEQKYRNLYLLDWVPLFSRLPTLLYQSFYAPLECPVHLLLLLLWVLFRVNGSESTGHEHTYLHQKTSVRHFSKGEFPPKPDTTGPGHRSGISHPYTPEVYTSRHF